MLAEDPAAHAWRTRHSRVPDLGLRPDEMRLTVRPHVAVRKPRQRGIGKAGWKAFTDLHEVFKEANLDGVVRAGLSARDAVVCLRHEPFVAGLVGPATKDVRHAGFATAPASALAEAPRLATQASPGLLTGPKRPAVSNATPDPLDQHEITITGRQSHPLIAAMRHGENLQLPCLIWAVPVEVR